jgi:predicted lipoprotein with Yx(FWY)xxD motif
MTQTKAIALLAGASVVPLATLAFAAGGAGAAAATTHAETVHAPTPTVAAARATVQVRAARLGKVLVDSRGRTLYLFKKDSGTKSACSGACAAAWPPLRSTGRPTVGSGAKASKVATTRRSDGASQVTYNGHPLYRFIGDKKPGDTNGEGLTAFGGSWFALSPAGNQISPHSASSGTSNGY